MGMLIDKTDEQLLQEAHAALHSVFEALDEGEWGINHNEDCPDDGTCECPAGKVAKQASDALNAIAYRLRFAIGKRVAERGMGAHTAHKVKKLEGNKVVTECNFVLHHEHFFEVDKDNPQLKPIPGCYKCFPEEQADFLPPGTHLAIHGCVHRDGTRTKNIGCTGAGPDGWTLRAAMEMANEGDPGAIVEVIKLRDCPTHGVGGEEGHTEEDFAPGGRFADAH